MAHIRGVSAEEVAARHLRASGWTVLGRRVRIGRHEVDLVAVDPGPPPELVLVEVRFRSRSDFGEAEETVGAAKRGELGRLLGIFLVRSRLPDGTPLPPFPRRVDLLAVGPKGGRASPIRHHRGLELGR